MQPTTKSAKWHDRLRNSPQCRALHARWQSEKLQIGHAAWFRDAGNFFLSPIAWQGRAYWTAWLLGIVIPTSALLHWHRTPEAIIWLATSSLFLFRDMRHIRQQLRAQTVIHIPSDPPPTNYSRQL